MAQARDPLVSVCIPTWNRERLLAGALDSVLSQKFGDFEVIVSDNASSDGTGDLVRACRDGRLRYLRNETNVGAPANWIRAAAAARGRYIMIIGDDDLLSPSFLETLVAPLESDPRVVVSFCDHWVIDGSGSVQQESSERYSRSYGRARLRPGRHEPFLDLALHDQALLTSAALVRLGRARSLDALDIRAGRVLDYYLFAVLSLYPGAAYYIPERLAYYRIHTASGSSLYQADLWRDMSWVCENLVGRVPGARHARRLRTRWARAMTGEGAALLRRGDRRGALRSFGHAVRMAPLAPRPWIGLAVASTIGRWPPL